MTRPVPFPPYSGERVRVRGGPGGHVRLPERRGGPSAQRLNGGRAIIHPRGRKTRNAKFSYRSSTTRITGLFQDGYAIFDARLVYETHDRRYSIGVYANNLFDETYKTDGQEFSSIGSIRTVYYGAPRTFMVRAGVHF